MHIPCVNNKGTYINLHDVDIHLMVIHTCATDVCIYVQVQNHVWNSFKEQSSNLGELHASFGQNLLNYSIDQKSEWPPHIIYVFTHTYMSVSCLCVCVCVCVYVCVHVHVCACVIIHGN